MGSADHDWGPEMASSRRRRRRRRYAVGQQPWLLREYGGAPMWLLCAAVVFVGAVAVFWLVLG